MESSSTSSRLSFSTRDLSVSLAFDNAMSQLAIARAHRLCCRTAVAGVAGLVLGASGVPNRTQGFAMDATLGLSYHATFGRYWKLRLFLELKQKQL